MMMKMKFPVMLSKVEEQGWVIIIVFYFGNVAFFHAMLGLDIWPKVYNQTSGDTLQDLTRPLMEQSPTASYPIMGIGASFWWQLSSKYKNIY